MIMFLESPWPAVAVGAVVIGMLAIMLLRTGRAMWLGVIAGAAVLTLGLVVLERFVVTQREQLEDTLAEIADTLEHNEAAQTMRWFSDDSPRRRETEILLGRVTIKEAKVVSDLKIRSDDSGGTPSAIVELTGRFHASERNVAIPYETPIRFTVTFHRLTDRWLVYDYAVADLRGQIAAGPVGGNLQQALP